jgi:hypothetical protein
MKFLATAAVWLSCAVFVATADIVVVVKEVRPSSQNARLTILSGGKRQPGANLAVYNADNEQKLSLKADSHGKATLPDLPPGRYCVTASTSPILRADLCLQIANGHARKRSAFSMDLVVQPPPPPTLEEKLEAAEKAPIEVRTRAFSGTVRDPVGAVISRASVAVYRYGARDTAHPLKTTTDQQGGFYAALAPGKYTAVIQSPGFETRFLTFEISPDAGQEDLNVKLNIGAIA